ncbi:hypothetical protein [Accumulibacter sp.]|uniref:hypothetical protein n=1 Tax=Accumulibacter sp. TaxID=2053492 RepID=UPI00261B2075|nr:hypothetical protein [Accumulibacter sp.]
MPDLLARLRRIPPATLAFAGSLLLSGIAVSGTLIVGRDGALYLDTAQKAVDHGLRAAFLAFDWPWFSLLIAATHRLSALPLEWAAQLWCALFLAATCALLVVVSQRCAAGSGYWACLIVLSVPAYNHLRGDIIREFGFWFFGLLALWLAVAWREHGGWRRALLVQLAIAAASLFRLEAVLLAPAVLLCLLGDLSRRQGWLNLLQLGALPLAGLAAALLSLWSGADLSAQQRIAYYLTLLDPRNLFAGLDTMASRFAAAALEKYSTDDARQIVLFGVTSALLVKFLTLNGPFCLPLLWPASWRSVVVYWSRLRPFAWTAVLYFGVLLLFFFQQRFTNSRYMSLLNLLAVPLLSLACLSFARHFPRLAKALVAVAVVVMLSNVISFGPRKTHYLEAAGWLSQNTQASDAVYYDDVRIAYYAGRGYPSMPVERGALMAADPAAQFRYLVLNPKPDDPLYRSLIERHWRVVARFANRKGDSIVVLER